MSKKTFTLRLTEAQHKILEGGASDRGITKNEYIVRMLEEHSTYEKILEKLEEIEKQIKK